MTTCLECKEQVNAKEQLQRHHCGLLYGLTPYFPFDSYYLKQKEKKLRRVHK